MGPKPIQKPHTKIILNTLIEKSLTLFFSFIYISNYFLKK